MKKIFLSLLPLLAFAACRKCEEPTICTQELRMVVLHVQTPGKTPVTLDSAYTVRTSTGERIAYPHSGQGAYTVLDDSYQPRLKSSADDFLFQGWLGGTLVVNELYRISADKCHISKRSGADSVTVR